MYQSVGFLSNAASVTNLIAANVLLLAVIFGNDGCFYQCSNGTFPLVGDMLPKHQGTIGFSVQTVFLLGLEL